MKCYDDGYFECIFNQGEEVVRRTECILKHWKIRKMSLENWTRDKVPDKIGKLKNNKSPRMDGVTAELLKRGGV